MQRTYRYVFRHNCMQLHAPEESLEGMPTGRSGLGHVMKYAFI